MIDTYIGIWSKKAFIGKCYKLLLSPSHSQVLFELTSVIPGTVSIQVHPNNILILLFISMNDTL